MSGGLSSPWMLGTFVLQSSSLSTEFSTPSSSLATCGGSAVCRSHFRAPKDLKFVLHDALDSSGFNTAYARPWLRGETFGHLSNGSPFISHPGIPKCGIPIT